MSEKKPVVTRDLPTPGLCPVCGKASYSRNGTHPQCAAAKADSLARAAQSCRYRNRQDAAQVVVQALPQVQATDSRPANRLRLWSHFRPRAGRPRGAARSSGSLTARHFASRFGPDLPILEPTPCPLLLSKTKRSRVRWKARSRPGASAAPCRISVATLKGEVTLTGTVRYAQQKQTAVQVAHGVSGVRNIVDRLMVVAPPKN